MRLLILILTLATLTGCVTNPYQEFYSPDEYAAVNLTRRDFSETGELKIIPYQGSPTEQMNELYRDGYVYIGGAAFTSGSVSVDQLREQAVAVGADAVLVSEEYLSTSSGSIPMTLPNTTTTYHAGTVNTFGGFGTFSGTSTNYGTTTTYIPYSTDRYKYEAGFYIKTVQPRLGVFFAELSAELARETGSNKGALISIVRRGSAAFNADVFEGDIVRKINGTEIISWSDALERASQISGPITLTIYRDGEFIDKTL